MVASEYDKTNHISVQGVGGWWWCGGECGVVMKMGGIRNGIWKKERLVKFRGQMGSDKTAAHTTPPPPSPEISFLPILLFHNPICTQPWGQIQTQRNLSVLGPHPMKTWEDQWNVSLWRSSRPMNFWWSAVGYNCEDQWNLQRTSENIASLVLRSDETTKVFAVSANQWFQS